MVKEFRQNFDVLEVNMKIMAVLVLVLCLFVNVDVVNSDGWSKYSGDVTAYQQKPHLKIKCTCGASFVTYEWLTDLILKSADKFMEKHPCAHKEKKTAK